MLYEVITDHLVLRQARMGVESGERDDHGVGRERLALELPAAGRIHGVGDRGAELRDVEVLGAAAHFLAGGEGDADRTVSYNFV